MQMHQFQFEKNQQAEEVVESPRLLTGSLRVRYFCYYELYSMYNHLFA
jgi:hypothetical protein